MRKFKVDIYEFLCSGPSGVERQVDLDHIPSPRGLCRCDATVSSLSELFWFEVLTETLGTESRLTGSLCIPLRLRCT